MDCPKTESRIRHIPYERYKDFTTFDISEIQENLSRINWKKVHNGRGRVTRSSAWFTDEPCKCSYAYGNSIWQAQPFAPWMKALVSEISGLLNIAQDKIPNSINCNRYDNFSESLNWHADDEPLFKTIDGNITIVSLSFGEPRKFSYKKNFTLESEAKHVVLCAGDVLTMEGKMQSHYQHCIPPSSVNASSAVRSTTRYNMTMRFVANHKKPCAC